MSGTPNANGAPPQQLANIFEKAALHHASAEDNSVEAQQPLQPRTFHRGASDLLNVSQPPQMPSEDELNSGNKNAEEQAATAKGWMLVQDFLWSQGDRAVHFSGECTEVHGNLPVSRYVILTENAIYRIPRTTIDTGIFFDCRTSLDELAQIVALEGDSGAQTNATSTEENETTGSSEFYAQFFRGIKTTQSGYGATASLSSPGIASPESNRASSKRVQLVFQLSFGANASRRKSLLMALSVVRPSLAILRKTKVRSTTDADYTLDSFRNSNYGSPTPAKSHNTTTGVSPIPRTPTSTRRRMILSPQSVKRNSIQRQRHYETQTASTNAKRASIGRGASGSQDRGSSLGGSSSAYPTHHEVVEAEPAVEISDSAFESYQQQLRSLLEDNSAHSIGEYNAEKVSARPKEEGTENIIERERIKAMLKSREAQMVQAIDFKVKYPQKVPTRVPPGVEYDKAHEERQVAPDHFSDEELLGPSLWSLWLQWKQTGGLQAAMDASGSPRRTIYGTDISPHTSPGMDNENDWSLYDSSDLVDSLRAREDRLYGYVGSRSMVRLQQMRELVERERIMFLNKLNACRQAEKEHALEAASMHSFEEDFTDEYSDDYSSSPVAAVPRAHSASAGYCTPGRSIGRVKSKKRPTKVEPFCLSQSPSTMRKLAVVDSSAMISDMKKNFDNHLRKMHDIRKEQLERELQRAEE